MKKIIAFVSALTVFVTSAVGWNLVQPVEAAGSTEAAPVTLEGFTTITTEDFENADGDAMPASKRYTSTETFTLKDYENYDKKLLTLKVNFEGLGHNTRLEFLGIDESAFYYVYPLEAGRLMMTQSGTMTTQADPSYSLCHACNAKVEEKVDYESS